MFHIIGRLFVLLHSAGLTANETFTIHSKYVNDDYIITLRKPAVYSDQKKYRLVYVADGSLGLGEYILGSNRGSHAKIPNNCVIIAISHIGNLRQKRPRDFIPSDISHNPGTNFGKAELFYLFLQKELIPLVENDFPNRLERVFIGHSYGGLFCLYTLFRPGNLFDRHFAISPSIWANYYELEKIEKGYSQKHNQLKADVTIYAGSLEFLNKVLYSSRRFYKIVRSRKYTGLSMVKKEIAFTNHYSVRKPAIDKIFDLLRK